MHTCTIKQKTFYILSAGRKTTPYGSSAEAISCASSSVLPVIEWVKPSSLHSLTAIITLPVITVEAAPELKHLYSGPKKGIMRRSTRLTILMALAVLLSFSTAAQTDDNGTEFEIVTINGEDADQVNEIVVDDRGSIDVGLKNADYENAKFMAYLDGQEMFMGDDEEITLKPEYDISEGEHQLRIERQSRREEDVSRKTTVKVTSGDTDEDSGSIDFEIDRINGEDASKVNDLNVKVGERVDMELAGVGLEASSFTAYIDGTEMHVEDGGIVTVADIKNVGTGQHELEMEYYHAGGTSTASTQVNIVDIEDSRSDGRSEPGEFTIDSLAGEDADRKNELKLSEGDEMNIELEGIDSSKYRFRAFIDGVELPVTNEGIMMTTEVKEVEEGEHTLRIASIFEGEEKTEAETEVKVTEIETRRDRRKPEELDSELYDEDFSPDVEGGMKVERGDGEITVTVTSEGLNNDRGEVVVGDSIQDITKLRLNFRRGLGGQGEAARLKIEEKDPETVENGDIEVYAVLELSGKNLEILAPNIRYAVKDEWADKHGFDEAIRERGGGRQNTEIGFYDVEEDWKRFDTRIRDSTPTHSMYSLTPRRIDQDFGLESKTNTIAIGGNPEGGITYAEGPQGQCESFVTSEEVPPGWTKIDKSCTELDQLRREREQLRNSINNLKEDLQENKDRGEQEDIEKLNDALEELDKGNVDTADEMYQEVQDKTAKGFLRQFIIKTVKDVFPF